MATKPGSCFICAPFGFNTQALEECLAVRQIRWKHIAEVSATRSVLRSAESEIRSSDFVCGIISADFPSPNVLFELGVATGLGKPMLVFIEPTAEVPIDLKGLANVSALPKNQEGYALHLDAFIRNAYGREKKPSADSAQSAKRGIAVGESLASGTLRAPPKEKEDVGWARAALEAMKIPSERPNERAQLFVNLVKKLFEQAGAQVTETVESKAIDSAYDMAVWADSLEDKIGNPIIVQLKTRLPSDRLPEAERQLFNYLTLTRSRCGLLIYLSGDRPTLPLTTLGKIAPSTLVLTMSVDDVISLVEQRRLFRHILTLRNRAAHGID